MQSMMVCASAVVPTHGIRGGVTHAKKTSSSSTRGTDVSPPSACSSSFSVARQRQHNLHHRVALQSRRCAQRGGRGSFIVVHAASSSSNSSASSDDEKKNASVDNDDDENGAEEEPSSSLPADEDDSASEKKTGGEMKKKTTEARASDDDKAKSEKKMTNKNADEKESDDEDDEESLTALVDDDVAPALEGDWRDFRAMLVSQEAGEKADADGSSTSSSSVASSSSVGPSSEAVVAEASGENLELLKKQNPELAAEKPWAHVIGAPEKGCLLVAAEEEFKLGQQYFHQSVILILEHHDKGSMGVILNRPTQYNMGYVSGDAKGPFAENALYFGGDVGDGTVSFLHGSELVRGSAEVLPGVYVGGYESACELVKCGDIDAKDFKFFARYCGWGPGQLESECERGVWYPVACSKQLALKQVIRLPKPLWREVLELCGGELKMASKRAYGELDEEEEDDEEEKEEEVKGKKVEERKDDVNEA